ncbi:MAG: exosome complex protein Rrp42 [Nanoarchaeota archaeon]|nr:exosome complex protein Rrp42 [Nanoarchaeota archaeon]
MSKEISNVSKQSIKKYLDAGVRFDGRKLDEYRDISVEFGVSENAESSVKVKMGETEVIAGIKMDVGEPYADSQNKGNLITTLELLPMSSGRHESGPPKIEAIEMGRVIDRGLRESGFIDFEKLCIKEGEKVWNVYVDIFSFNDAGGMLDAAFLAAVIAMKTAKLPRYDEKEEVVKFGELTDTNFPVTDLTPVTITGYKVGGHIIIDPTVEEEEMSEARLSFGLAEVEKEIMISSCQKGKDTILTSEEVGKIIDLSENKYKELFGVIDKAIKGIDKK